MRGGIESASYPQFMEASWQESSEVFAFAPDAQSYAYAGVAARAASLLSIDPNRAQGYRDSALKAMQWAGQENRNNPDGNWITGNERNLAALEGKLQRLWRARPVSQ